jgi:hypothetical protein
VITSQSALNFILNRFINIGKIVSAPVATRPAHRRRLTELHERDALLAAGPWADDSGALLIFRLDEPAVRTD